MPTLAPKLPWQHPFAGGYPRREGQALPTDPDAIDYLNRVAAADGASVEVGIAQAVDAFVRGCKADGTWNAIQASCIMCGARTLSGALVPLKGAAPTPYNFASGDYSRSGSTPGLKGDGTTKYLDTGLNNTSVGRDDRHVSIYRTYGNPAGGSHYQIGAYSSTPSPAHLTAIRPLSGGTCAMYGGGSNGPSVPSPAGYETGFLGVSRAVSTGFNYRTPSSGSLFFSSSNSNAPQDQNFFVFSTSLNGNSPFTRTDGRLAFYSVGAALDLAKMDTRVTNLVTAIKFHSLTGLLPNDFDVDTISYIVAAIEAGGTL